MWGYSGKGAASSSWKAGRPGRFCAAQDEPGAGPRSDRWQRSTQTDGGDCDCDTMMVTVDFFTAKARLASKGTVPRREPSGIPEDRGELLYCMPFICASRSSYAQTDYSAPTAPGRHRG